MRCWAIKSLLFVAAANAQDCSIPFTLPLFGVQVESDVWYGNATRFNGGTDSLRLNLYKPVGDGQVNRPLVVLIHGGGFIEGHRNDWNALCEVLASHGYAAATISYRLGYYGNGLLDPPYAYDPNEMVRASYRAMQDTKGAIRYLKGRSAQDSTSSTSVFVLGASAGGITALHATYLDQPNEKPASCGAIGPVQHLFNFYPRPDLGGIDGDLHQNGHDAGVLGVVNIFGAMIDTSFMQSAADPALFSYHQSGDPVVGCGVQRPYWGIGLGLPDQHPWLHGSCSIDARVLHLGFTPDRYRFILHLGNEHAVHDPAGVLAEAMQWMRDLMCANVAANERPPAGAARIVPNPAGDAATVLSATGGVAAFDLVDGQGRLLRNGNIMGPRHDLDLRGMPAGAYFIRIAGPEGISVLRLLKD
jgi:hypothetical protein